MTRDSEPDLSPGELALPRDAQTDDVSYVWVLIELGLRESPPSSPDWRPGTREVDAAFQSLERLHERGRSMLGESSTRMVVLRGGWPVRHIAEPLAD